MKFPQTIRHHKAEATIYGRTARYTRYRLSYHVAGKRRQLTFASYGEAKAQAERVVRELASGSQAIALSASQARDSLAALQSLEGYRLATGRRVSLLGAVSEFVEAATKLQGQPLGDAVNRFLATVATVQRKDLLEAVEEFIGADEPRTRASEGQRAQLSAKYAYNRAIQLRRFAGTFPNTALCDLGKEHLDAFMGSLKAFSAKSRNHHRAAVRQFLQWAVRKDFLAGTHRLGEADAMRPERANTAEVQFYAPKEFAQLLEAADGSMRAIIAIGGLAGLRTAELLRLDWADVWRVPGHIEVSSSKSKTRQRRLVEVCPTLASWLEPFRTMTTGKLCTLHEITFQHHFVELCEQIKVARKTNGLRHAFCSYHFALHSNENKTAAQAGNSPGMVHSNYKGLCTKAEAEKWFTVAPSKPAENLIQMPTTA